MQIPGTALLVQWLRIHLLTGEEFGGEWIRVYVWLSPFSLFRFPGTGSLKPLGSP